MLQRKQNYRPWRDILDIFVWSSCGGDLMAFHPNDALAKSIVENVLAG